MDIGIDHPFSVVTPYFAPLRSFSGTSLIFLGELDLIPQDVSPGDSVKLIPGETVEAVLEKFPVSR